MTTGIGKKARGTLAGGVFAMAACMLAGCAADNAAAPAVTAAPDRGSMESYHTHVREAAARFNMPEPLIHAVIMQESGGRSTVGGKPLRSRAGAIGLMQVLPETYAELQKRYGLGPDLTDPRSNILAGVAYLREQYDTFGWPCFLSAYNCGPGCTADAIAGVRRQLPAESRQYLARLAPVAAVNPPPPPPGRLVPSHARTATGRDGRPVWALCETQHTRVAATPPIIRAAARRDAPVQTTTAVQPASRTIVPRFPPVKPGGCGPFGGRRTTCVASVPSLVSARPSQP